MKSDYPEKLKKARTGLKLTQDDVAKRWNFTDGNYIYMLESKTKPFPKHLEAEVDKLESELAAKSKSALRETHGRRFIAAPIYGQLQTSTLERNLIDLVRHLPKSAPGERRHILGNIRAMLDELEDREINPKVSSKPRVEGEDILDELERQHVDIDDVGSKL